MTTATDERVEFDVDLTKDVPCGLDDCDLAAEWVLRTPCCKTVVWLLCDPHRALTDVHVANLRRHIQRPIRCHCGAVFPLMPEADWGRL